MLAKSDSLAAALSKGVEGQTDPLVIVPSPNIDDLRDAGAGSIDFRLGRWFMTLRHTRHEVLDIFDSDAPSEESLTTRHFVPFGEKFILHPGSFVLGATLEWVRVPSNYAAYVSGKSSLARRGLIIETAMGVHPGFSGCITLEIANLGAIPIALRPGMQICQCFFHTATGSEERPQSVLTGFRRPTLGSLRLDNIAKALMSPRS